MQFKGIQMFNKIFCGLCCGTSAEFDILFYQSMQSDIQKGANMKKTSNTNQDHVTLDEEHDFMEDYAHQDYLWIKAHCAGFGGPKPIVLGLVVQTAEL